MTVPADDGGDGTRVEVGLTVSMVDISVLWVDGGVGAVAGPEEEPLVFAVGGLVGVEEVAGGEDAGVEEDVGVLPPPAGTVVMAPVPITVAAPLVMV